MPSTPPAAAAHIPSSPTSSTQPPSQPHLKKTEHYYCANFVEFTDRLRACRGRLGVCLEQLGVVGAAAASNDPNETHCDSEDVLHAGVVAALDDHLDRVDRSLDDIAAGRGDQTNLGSGSVPVAAVGKQSTTSATTTRGTTEDANVFTRPQDFFTPRVDNSDTPYHPPTPFGFPEPECESSEPNVSPIQNILDALVYATHALQVADELLKNENRPPLIFVDTEQGLVDLSMDLNQVNEFAVDLEHHSLRTFKGFTCLVQVSTRDRDYIIDVLNPDVRASMGKQLGGIFLDPKIVKIFHGAEYDVKWLQRDFGIYVVNMFDTYQASKLLEFPQKSLAYLLQLFCGITADKQYQLADWRIRPLSDALLHYASTDTKHLIYVYESLKKRLRDVSVARSNGDPSFTPSTLIRQVFDNSKTTCASVYVPPTYSASDWRVGYFKLAVGERDLSPKQLSVFAAIHTWRDATARSEDESIGYVVSKSLLLRISRTNPESKKALLAVTRGDAPLVAKHAEQLIDLITRAAVRGAPPGIDINDGSEEVPITQGGDVGGAPVVLNDSNTTGVSSEVKRNSPKAPPGKISGTGGSAMASMMGVGSIGKNKKTATDVKSGGSAMARMLMSASGTLSTSGVDALVDTLDTAALSAAAKIRNAFFAKTVPLHDLFPTVEAGSGFAQTLTSTGRHAREQIANRGVAVAEKNAQGPGEDTKKKTSSSTLPVPLRKDVNEKKRKAAAAEVEAEAATKARAAAARDELARRRGSFAPTGEESDGDDSNSEDGDGTRNGKLDSGIDPEDEQLLNSVGGFDFAAAAAAALPQGASFEALGAKSGRRRGKGGDGSNAAGSGATNKKKESKRMKSGKYDANGRMIMVEPFKPGKKSKAFPRSGERNETFR